MRDLMIKTWQGDIKVRLMRLKTVYIFRDYESESLDRVLDFAWSECSDSYANRVAKAEALRRVMKRVMLEYRTLYAINSKRMSIVDKLYNLGEDEGVGVSNISIPCQNPNCNETAIVELLRMDCISLVAEQALDVCDFDPDSVLCPACQAREDLCTSQETEAELRHDCNNQPLQEEEVAS